MRINLGLFDGLETTEPGGRRPGREVMGDGAVLLHRFAIAHDAGLMAAVAGIARDAPFRRMVTPGGFRMSVSMTNCGAWGWVTDQDGYRYAAGDPVSERPWPPMPDSFRALAGEAAADAGFDRFVPDACLINRYEPGARMSLHQDKDERDFNQPIVSVSLGVPAVFLFGGPKRSDKPARFHLEHGDVVVWGGPSRLRYHGVMPIKEAHHPSLGVTRINLTLRKSS